MHEYKSDEYSVRYGFDHCWSYAQSTNGQPFSGSWGCNNGWYGDIPSSYTAQTYKWKNEDRTFSGGYYFHRTEVQIQLPDPPSSGGPATLSGGGDDSEGE